jgi:hypothetical protein
LLLFSSEFFAFPFPASKTKQNIKTIISPVRYGCKTWSLPLREEHGLRVFENTVLRRIFVLKREEVVRGWRRLHNEELHKLYASLNNITVIKSRKVRWEGTWHTWLKQNFGWKPEGAI